MWVIRIENIFVFFLLILILDTINCLLIYEYVAKSNMDETPMLRSLVTKPSSELIHIALKGFSRTLLIAGLSNGCIAVLKWNTGEIDFSLDVCE